MLRRILPTILIGIGAFGIVGAVTILLLGPGFIRIPLTQQTEVVARGQDVEYFDNDTLTRETGADITVVRRVLGDPAAEEAGPDVAVWSTGTAISDPDGTLVLPTVEATVCLDRKTSLAVTPCAAAQVNDERVDINGLLITFPIGTQQRDYDMFDATARATHPVRFLGVDDVQGTEVLRFETRVPPTAVGTREVPGEYVGGEELTTVVAETVYSNLRTFWVEPTTGIIVRGEEEPDIFLRGPDGTRGYTIMSGRFLLSDESVTEQLAYARSSQSRIALLRWIGPLTLGAIGLLALGGAWLLTRRRGGRNGVDHDGYGDDARFGNSASGRSGRTSTML